MIPTSFFHGASQPTSPVLETAASPSMYDAPANAGAFASGFPVDQNAYAAPGSGFTYPYGYPQPSYGASTNSWDSSMRNARYAQPAAAYGSFSGPYPNQGFAYSTGVPSFPVASQPGPDSMPMNASFNNGMPVPGEQQPSYVGYVKTTADAILLLSACDLPSSASALSPASGLRTRATPPPRRVTRRLLDSERISLIRSGSAFCWDEKEAGMKRWTDGRCWSASRVSGCFLTYRELEARKKPAHSGVGNGPTQNQYKIDGLIKQSFSMTTTSGRKLHIINYYTNRDIREGRLRRVSEDPRFVGEGGGEWGLNVDEAEYPDPAARLEENAEGGDESASGSVASPRSIPSQPSDHQYFGSSAQPSMAPDSPPSTAPHSASGAIASFGERGAQYAAGFNGVSTLAATKRSGLAGGAVSPAPRFVANFPPLAVARPRLGKRLLRDEDDNNGDHLRASLKGHYLHDNSHERLQRPRLSRPRGSSPASRAVLRVNSDGSSSSDTRSGGSFQGSATSIATTVESNSRDSGDEKDKTAPATHQHSSSLLGLSSLMASAPKMALSRSEQESAVGALLSLRGDGPSAASSSKPAGEQRSDLRERSPSSPKGAALATLPSLPSRTNSDRQALNMFSIRL